MIGILYEYDNNKKIILLQSHIVLRIAKIEEICKNELTNIYSVYPSDFKSINALITNEPYVYHLINADGETKYVNAIINAIRK